MRFSLGPARSAAAGIAGLLMLTGCELALHELQQARTDECDPWKGACPVLIDDRGPDAVPLARVDRERAETLLAAIEAPYRPCNTVGLVCQGRIIGDVLWDQYVMVLTGRSHAAPVAASAQRPGPGEPKGPAAAGAAQPAPEPGRIVRTYGSRAGGVSKSAAGATTR